MGYPFIESISLENFMNHKNTVIEFQEEGQTAICGANGVGKSAILEAFAFIGSNAGSSRFANWKEPFKKTKEGEVRLVINERSSKKVIFSKKFRNNMYYYYINEKPVSQKSFADRLSLLGFAFTGATIIAQGETSEKFAGKGKGTLRELVERATGDDILVKEYQDIQSLIEQNKARIKEDNQKLQEINSKVQELNERVEILQKYEEIEKRLKEMRLRLESSRILRKQRDLQFLDKNIQDLETSHSRWERQKDSHSQVLKYWNSKYRSFSDEAQKKDNEFKVLQSSITALDKEINEIQEDSNFKKIHLNRRGVLQKRFEYLEKITTAADQEFAKNQNQLAISEIEEINRQIGKQDAILGTLGPEIAELDKEIENASKTTYNSKEHQKLNSNLITLTQEINALSLNCDQLGQEKIELGEKEVSKIKLWNDFELFAKKHKIKVIGPACMFFKQKSGSESNEGIRQILIRAGGRNLHSYITFKPEDQDKANQFNKDKPSHLQIPVFLLMEADEVGPAPPGTHGYLADFIDIKPELQPWVWAVFKKTLLVDDSNTARRISKTHRKVCVTFEGERFTNEMGLPSAGYLNPPIKEFQNRFGSIDPENLELQKNALEASISALQQQIEEMSIKERDLREIVNSMDVVSKILENLPNLLQQREIKQDDLRQAQKSSEELTIQLSEKKNFYEKQTTYGLFLDELKEKKDHLEKDLVIASRFEEKTREISMLRERQQSIVDENLLNNLEFAQGAVNTYTSMIRRCESKISRNQAKVGVIRGQRKTLNEIIRSDLESLGVNDISSFSIEDEFILQKQIKDTEEQSPPITTIDREAKNKLKEVQKKQTGQMKKLTQIQQNCLSLEEKLSIVAQQWVTDFANKINQIGIEVNNLLRFLGINVTFTLAPLDINNAFLDLKVERNGMQLVLPDLSGGQKSFLNLLVFLGANAFSQHKFCLLDEMDQNLDPVSTKMAKDVLKRYSANKQIILLSPTKDPQILNDAKIIWLDDRGSGPTVNYINPLTRKEVAA